MGTFFVLEIMQQPSDQRIRDHRFYDENEAKREEQGKRGEDE